MTNAEVAELRGELLGLKALLLNCLAFIANQTGDASAHLDTIQKEAIAGIAKATHSSVEAANLGTFQAAAAGIVVQAVEAAKKTTKILPPRSQMQ